MRLVCTQIYLVKGAQVCLPLKKRGFGKGWHNGYGGKVKPTESLEAGAIRELFEESGVKAGSLEKRAILNFVFLHTGKEIESHVYWCEEFMGLPQETNEMQPFWFGFKQVPYGKMWPDDKYWFPRFLAGEKFRAEFEFLDDKPTIGQYGIKILESI
jgi:8-oxo-dGTP pyrophosphatase MutT (NUDIX family)